MTGGIAVVSILLPLACSVVFASHPPKLNATQSSSVKLFFYSNEFPKGIALEDGRSLEQYNPSRSLKLVIHGWNTSRHQRGAILPIRDAYLKQNQHNLLMADWSDIAALPYQNVRPLVQRVGERIATILGSFLDRKAIPHGQIHVLGHSLGAHIAGHVGRRFGGKFSRLTALDPAGPMFTRRSADAFNNADAQFVDAIHTDGSYAGELFHRAHVDFYPNGGTGSQPGCELLDILTKEFCSHSRAAVLYAESIHSPNNFIGQECKEDLSRLPLATCTELTGNLLTQSVAMGEHVSRSVRGTFYLKTAKTAPYGLGDRTSR